MLSFAPINMLHLVALSYSVSASIPSEFFLSSLQVAVGVGGCVCFNCSQALAGPAAGAPCPLRLDGMDRAGPSGAALSLPASGRVEAAGAR